MTRTVYLVRGRKNGHTVYYGQRQTLEGGQRLLEERRTQGYAAHLLKQTYSGSIRHPIKRHEKKITVRKPKWVWRK